MATADAVEAVVGLRQENLRPATAAGSGRVPGQIGFYVVLVLLAARLHPAAAVDASTSFKPPALRRASRCRWIPNPFTAEPTSRWRRRRRRPRSSCGSSTASPPAVLNTVLIARHGVDGGVRAGPDGLPRQEAALRADRRHDLHPELRAAHPELPHRRPTSAGSTALGDRDPQRRRRLRGVLPAADLPVAAAGDRGGGAGSTAPTSSRSSTDRAAAGRGRGSRRSPCCRSSPIGTNCLWPIYVLFSAVPLHLAGGACRSCRAPYNINYPVVMAGAVVASVPVHHPVRPRPALRHRQRRQERPEGLTRSLRNDQGSFRDHGGP